jgi:DNA helicase-2/ATP-dependent DNA helicase PcrA
MQELDSSQRVAATMPEDIQLVLAGPGSGKTTTLTGRFIHLVHQGVDRRRILALTFTKKAADEMKARIVQALNLPSGKDVTIATFHGFAFRHLRRHPAAAGLLEDFQLWDTPQQRQVFNTRRMWWNEDIDILDIIGGAKERLLNAETFAAQINDGIEDDDVMHKAVEFFKVYENALHAAGAIDFADMVPVLVRAMARSPDYCTAITGAYDHLLVDEYQDVNPGQVELIDRFVNAGIRLWVVGDDDQTLYAFRAADVRFILDFAQRYKDVRVHILDHNYRSGAQIVAAGKRLIGNNRARRNKNQRSAVVHSGEITIRGYSTAAVEARQVARGVARLLKHFPPQQIAVLYRIGSVGLLLQPELQRMQIPYEVRGAGDLWQGVTAKLVVGSLYYLRDGESVAAMSRMGSGKRADIARRQLDEAAPSEKKSFQAACRLVRKVVATAVPGKASERDRGEWTTIVEAVIALASSCESLEQLSERIAEQSAALRNPPENAVVLSTIHSAKGLEWEAVLLMGMEEGVLPHASTDDLEEERRVAYVGVTRAKRILGLTYAEKRFRQTAIPSRFLEELAGGRRRLCIWTSPQTPSDDERLPLLSDGERQLIARSEAHDAAPRRPTEEPKRRHGRRADLPPRHGQAWSPEEDERLRSSFLQAVSIPAMAAAHQRKKGAIRSRLVKLGLIDDASVA